MSKSALKALYKDLAPLADDVAEAAGKSTALPFVGVRPSVRKAVQDFNISSVYDDFETPYTGVTGIKIGDKWFNHPGPELDAEHANFVYDIGVAPEELFAQAMGGSQALKNQLTKSAILERMLRGERTYDVETRPRPVSDRPGSNTALGRFYAQQHPELKYNYPIGPVPLDDLPF